MYYYQVVYVHVLISKNIDDEEKETELTEDRS